MASSRAVPKAVLRWIRAKAFICLPAWATTLDPPSVAVSTKDGDHQRAR